MTIQLKPGDYVSTAGMTEEQYHAVARAFMDAGCKGFPDNFNKNARIVGWSGRFNRYGWDHKPVPTFWRELTIDQILGTTEPAWSGEGLPPVGVECEMARPGENHAPGCLRYASNELIVWQYENGVEIAIRPEHGGFRPLRSEEDGAVDEMTDVLLLVPDGSTMRDVAQVLYKAGYRKTGGTK